MITYPPLQYPLVLHRLERGIALYSDKQQLFRRPARVFETNGSGLKTLGNASDGAMITLESGWIFYTHPTIQHIHYTYTHILWTYTHNNNCYQNCDITKLLLLKKKYTSQVHVVYVYFTGLSLTAYLPKVKQREKKIRLLFLKLLIFLALIFEEKIRRQLFFIDIFLSF